MTIMRMLACMVDINKKGSRKFWLDRHLVSLSVSIYLSIFCRSNPSYPILET